MGLMQLRQPGSGERRALRVSALAVLVSLAVHGVIAAAPLVQDRPARRLSRLMWFDVVKPPRPPPVASRVESPPRPRPRPRPRRMVARHRPAAQPPAGPPAPPVFGATRESVTSGDSTFSVPLGNTVATSPDNRGPVEPGEPAVEPPPPPAPPPRPVTLRSKPRLLREVKVDYPAKARELGIEGTVKVRVRVGPDGRVQQTQVVSGPGFGLNQAAERALRRFRFRPAMGSDGKPMAYWITYRYTFQIEE